MSVQYIRNREVTRPTTTPLKSSLLDHVKAAGNFREVPGFGLRNEEGMWPSYNCLDTLVPTPLCPEPLSDPDRDPKTFAVAPWMPGFSFAVYGAVQCSLVGLDVADQQAEVKRVFGLNEGRGVEEALLRNRFVERNADDVTPGNRLVRGEWDGAVDITPEASVSIKVALAVLEGYARRVYAGVPTIHMPAAAVSLLDVVKWDGDLAYTSLGSKIAMGGGYDYDYEADEPHSGKMTMYATGEVYVEASEQVDLHAYELTGADASGTGLSSNTSVAIAERAYRAAVDCFVVKATGTAWSV